MTRKKTLMIGVFCGRAYVRCLIMHVDKHKYIDLHVCSMSDQRRERWPNNKHHWSNVSCFLVFLNANVTTLTVHSFNTNVTTLAAHPFNNNVTTLAAHPFKANVTTLATHPFNTNVTTLAVVHFNANVTPLATGSTSLQYQRYHIGSRVSFQCQRYYTGYTGSTSVQFQRYHTGSTSLQYQLYHTGSSSFQCQCYLTCNWQHIRPILIRCHRLTSLVCDIGSNSTKLCAQTMF